jgi:holliday junction DNA helicase RuvA
MLSYLKGKVVLQETDHIILEINNCVGLKIFVADPSSFAINQDCTVITELHVRENGFTIFGFHEKREVDIFNMLTSIPNLSSKASLKIFSQYSVNEFFNIVLNEDCDSLKGISGIGEKTGKKIILYMSEKIKKLDYLGESETDDNLIIKEARNMLIELGLSINDAVNLINHIPNIKSIKDPKIILKEALKLRKE